MADIQSVRYNVPQQAAPGFMDYAAQFLTNFMGRKQAEAEKKRAYEQELFKSMASALAAQKQIEYAPGEGQGMKIGDQVVPWRVVPAAREDAGYPVQLPLPGADRGLYQFNVKDLSDLQKVHNVLFPNTQIMNAVKEMDELRAMERKPPMTIEEKRQAYDELQAQFLFNRQPGSFAPVTPTLQPQPRKKFKFSATNDRGEIIYSNDNNNWFDKDNKPYKY